MVSPRSTPRSTTRRGLGPSERLQLELPLLRALPAVRPVVACGEERKVDRLATVRFCSARYSVPHRLVGENVTVQASDRDVVIMFRGVPVAQHALLAPGEASISRLRTTRRRRRPVSARCGPAPPSEHAFLALGDEARGLPARRRGGRHRPPARAPRRGARPRAHAWRRAGPRGARASDDVRALRARRPGIDRRRAWRPRRQPPSPTPRRWRLRGCRRSRSARWMTTAAHADDPAPGPRARGRAAPAAAARDARARARAAADRQDPALAAARAAGHAGA